MSHLKAKSFELLSFVDCVFGNNLLESETLDYSTLPSFFGSI